MSEFFSPDEVVIYASKTNTPADKANIEEMAVPNIGPESALLMFAREPSAADRVPVGAADPVPSTTSDGFEALKKSLPHCEVIVL